MIITLAKHNRIVSMKDSEIEILKCKLEWGEKLLEGAKTLYKDTQLELYEADKEANELSEELDRTKEYLKDTDIALDLMIDKVEELENENEELGDKILNMREDNVDLQKENNKYKKRLDRVREMLRQYKWYIDKSIEVGSVTHTITYKDIQKFHSKEGVEGLMKLYQLAAMMQ